MDMAPFHSRFGLAIDRTESEQRFINRALNLIFDAFYHNRQFVDPYEQEQINHYIALELGVEYSRGTQIGYYVEHQDLYGCLQCIEVFYRLLKTKEQRRVFNSLVDELFRLCEVDLEIEWRTGQFCRTGAESLDSALVREPLEWLRSASLANVLLPYEKGLRTMSSIRPHDNGLSHVVTDMYEALEALAKFVCENDSDLSANREMFIKNVRASDDYKVLLKQYVEYACKFRHAVKTGQMKPPLSVRETESFVYLTGVFLRLAIGSRDQDTKAAA